MSSSRWLLHDRGPVATQPTDNVTFACAPVAHGRQARLHQLYARSNDNRLVQYQWLRNAGCVGLQPLDDARRIESSPSVGSRNTGHEYVAAQALTTGCASGKWPATEVGELVPNRSPARSRTVPQQSVATTRVWTGRGPGVLRSSMAGVVPDS